MLCPLLPGPDSFLQQKTQYGMLQGTSSKIRQYILRWCISCRFSLQSHDTRVESSFLFQLKDFQKTKHSIAAKIPNKSVAEPICRSLEQDLVCPKQYWDLVCPKQYPDEIFYQTLSTPYLVSWDMHGNLHTEFWACTRYATNLCSVQFIKFNHPGFQNQWSLSAKCSTCVLIPHGIGISQRRLWHSSFNSCLRCLTPKSNINLNENSEIQHVPQPSAGFKSILMILFSKKQLTLSCSWCLMSV